MSFSMSVERLIGRWQHDGLIDEITAGTLRADLEKRGSGFGLGTVLATLGGLLLGAAVIMLVAANWQEIPRLARVLFILAIIWASYLGGAWRQSRGDGAFSSALYLIGAAAFGAGIALVGQMYHLSGDAASAALLWTGGVMASAFLLRAKVLAAAAMAIACFYLINFTSLASGDLSADPSWLWIGPLLAVFGGAAAIYTQSRSAGHILALFVIGWSFLTYFDAENVTILWLILFCGLGLLALEAFAHPMLQRLTRFAEPLASYGLIVALLALLILQLNERIGSFDDIQRDLIFSVIILALSIGALTLCGRNNNGLRWIAYAAFSIQVIYLAFVTVGTMIGTSGFFLTAGVLVLLLAAFVTRMERRMGRSRSAMMEAKP